MVGVERVIRGSTTVQTKNKVLYLTGSSGRVGYGSLWIISWYDIPIISVLVAFIHGPCSYLPSVRFGVTCRVPKIVIKVCANGANQSSGSISSKESLVFRSDKEGTWFTDKEIGTIKLVHSTSSSLVEYVFLQQKWLQKAIIKKIKYFIL